MGDDFLWWLVILAFDTVIDQVVWKPSNFANEHAGWQLLGCFDITCTNKLYMIWGKQNIIRKLYIFSKLWYFRNILLCKNHNHLFGNVFSFVSFVRAKIEQHVWQLEKHFWPNVGHKQQNVTSVSYMTVCWSGHSLSTPYLKTQETANIQHPCYKTHSLISPVLPRTYTCTFWNDMKNKNGNELVNVLSMVC